MKKIYVLGVMCLLSFCILSSCNLVPQPSPTAVHMSKLYGENHQITGTYSKDCAVACNNGIFVGQKKNGVISFKGIPYAKQPTGNLRWKPPVLAEDSNNVYEAYYFGKSPIQTQLFSEPASYYEHGEDCLNLNVWTSNRTQKKGKPVMVFIYGGAFGWGGTCDPLYDGQRLIEEHDDIVLVTIDYRAGILGFIDFSSIEGGENFKESGNLGLLDQVCALEWIHQNIKAFGGDPKNVTIFGESAGATSVSLLPIITNDNTLFQRVIAQSGSIEFTYSKDQCQELTNLLLAETNATCMDDLVALSEEEIMELNKKLNAFCNFPERDGITLPVDLYRTYKNSSDRNIDMLIGTNKDEVRYWIDQFGGESMYESDIKIKYEKIIRKLSDEDQSYAKQFMADQKVDKIWACTEFFNELMFRIPAILQASYQDNTDHNVYMYYWTYPSTIKHLGACHTIELSAIFNNLDETTYSGEPIDAKFAEIIQQMWVNFAKTGNPSTDTIRWTPFHSITKDTMILGNDMGMEQNILSEQFRMLAPLVKYHCSIF